MLLIILTFVSVAQSADCSFKNDKCPPLSCFAPESDQSSTGVDGMKIGAMAVVNTGDDYLKDNSAEFAKKLAREAAVRVASQGIKLAANLAGPLAGVGIGMITDALFGDPNAARMNAMESKIGCLASEISDMKLDIRNNADDILKVQQGLSQFKADVDDNNLVMWGALQTTRDSISLSRLNMASEHQANCARIILNVNGAYTWNAVADELELGAGFDEDERRRLAKDWASHNCEFVIIGDEWKEVKLELGIYAPSFQMLEVMVNENRKTCTISEESVRILMSAAGEIQNLVSLFLFNVKMRGLLTIPYLLNDYTSVIIGHLETIVNSLNVFVTKANKIVDYRPSPGYECRGSPLYPLMIVFHLIYGEMGKKDPQWCKDYCAGFSWCYAVQISIDHPYTQCAFITDFDTFNAMRSSQGLSQVPNASGYTNLNIEEHPASAVCGTHNGGCKTEKMSRGNVRIRNRHQPYRTCWRKSGNEPSNTCDSLLKAFPVLNSIKGVYEQTLSMVRKIKNDYESFGVKSSNPDDHPPTAKCQGNTVERNSRIDGEAGPWCKLNRCPPNYKPVKSLMDSQNYGHEGLVSCKYIGAGSLEFGDIGANGCPTYSTAAECEDYANKYSSLTWDRTDSWSNYPKGCFWQTQNNRVYFNTHATGAGISSPPTRPVCKTLGWDGWNKIAARPSAPRRPLPPLPQILRHERIFMSEDEVSQELHEKLERATSLMKELQVEKALSRLFEEI